MDTASRGLYFTGLLNCYLSYTCLFSMKHACKCPKYTIVLLLALVALTAIIIWYNEPLWAFIKHSYNFLSERDKVKAFIDSFGVAAPFAFIVIQMLQVLLAPIPGEASGFVGGYVFGLGKGFIYSTIGLTLGSWINFSIGRALGRRYVRKLIPAEKLLRFDQIIKRQGTVIIFFLFVFPGFPKDYLSLFVGLSAMSLRTFLLLAFLGRMPGTFLLSLQGAMLYEQMYAPFLITMAICFILAIFVFRYRESFYVWMERFDHSKEIKGPQKK